MDYLVFGENVYIKSNNNKFFSFDYNDNYIAEFSIDEKKDSIIAKSNTTDIESINLIAEILYFYGNKEKNVIYQSNDNDDLDLKGFEKNKNIYIKKVKEFEKERAKKFNSIDELYKYPYLVPWNLVERERDVLALVEKYVDKSKNILEIGSGYGKNLLLLKEHGYDNVQGIENSRNAYEISKQKIDNNTLGDITKTNYNDSKFDAIIDIGCLHCIDHKYQEKAVKEVLRILKKDGLLISRYFLPKDKKWLDRYPVKVTSFGSNYEELVKLFKNFNIIESCIENECVYIVGRKNEED